MYILVYKFTTCIRNIDNYPAHASTRVGQWKASCPVYTIQQTSGKRIQNTRANCSTFAGSLLNRVNEVSVTTVYYMQPSYTLH